MDNSTVSLPDPASNQAFCNVSALDGGTLVLPEDAFLADAIPGNTHLYPALCFLIHHSQRPERFLFDLGIHPDVTTYPPVIQQAISMMMKVDHTSQRCIESLAKGGLTPADIDNVCISHIHFDHTGDTHAFDKSTFLVGGACKPLLDDGFPGNPMSIVASDLLPVDRTRYLSSADWPPLGPFPRALDFYGDGSLYIVDSPGHVEGHVSILARTTADGAWIYLAGDSAHHWRLITGESQIKTGIPYGETYCAHADKAAAEEHIKHIRTLSKIARVQILLAHDKDWYEVNKGGDAFWPGKIPPAAK